jgi:sirohydrochlorin ferrochelatase
MKTQRVTLLTTPEFKEFLTKEAGREGVSVAELVRSRCEGRPGADAALLETLTTELRNAVRQAKTSLKRGLGEANAVLAELRAKAADNTEQPVRTRRPAK